MLALYKQYLTIEDKELVHTYEGVCKILYKQPIIFTDNLLAGIDEIKNIALFHTIYSTKINLSKLVYVVISEYDRKILNSILIPNNHIFILNIKSNITDTASQIKELFHEKL
jgi:hypothetical protein